MYEYVCAVCQLSIVHVVGWNSETCEDTLPSFIESGIHWLVVGQIKEESLSSF